ncbi:MAG TPA: PAS domain-containing protein [Mycobacteriales bacterium]
MPPSEPATDVVPAADILAGIAEAVVYADRGGVIRAWNAGATEVFGFSADEAVGRSLDLIIPERFRAAHWRGFDAAIERGATAGGRQARLTRGTHRDPDRVLYVEMSFAVVTAPDGSASGAVAVARDVTERQLREREERKRREAAAPTPEG